MNHMHIYAIKSLHRPKTTEAESDLSRTHGTCPHEFTTYFLISEATQRMTTAPTMAVPS